VLTYSEFVLTACRHLEVPSMPRVPINRTHLTAHPADMSDPCLRPMQTDKHAPPKCVSSCPVGEIKWWRELRLVGSRYADKTGMKKYFEPIFSEMAPPNALNDLTNMVTASERLPKFFLCYSLFDKNDYFLDRGLPLINALTPKRAYFYSEILPHGEHK